MSLFRRIIGLFAALSATAMQFTAERHDIPVLMLVVLVGALAMAWEERR